MILIVDNYDSFSFNLAQTVGSLGHHVRVWRNDEYELEDLDSLPLDAVIISPGPGVPESAGMSLQTIGHLRERLPILGVCLGHQAIGVYFGGRIIKSCCLMHGKTSQIYHYGDPIFAGIESPMEGMRYHSLLLDSSSLPSSMEVIARTAEGEIMGIRHRHYAQVVGVQFHPESYFTPHGSRILSNFLASLSAGERGAKGSEKTG